MMSCLALIGVKLVMDRQESSDESRQRLVEKLTAAVMITLTVLTIALMIGFVWFLLDSLRLLATWLLMMFGFA